MGWGETKQCQNKVVDPLFDLDFSIKYESENFYTLLKQKDPLLVSFSTEH